MSVIIVKSAVSKDLIDIWNSTTEYLSVRQGMTVDKGLATGVSNDKNLRSCETRFVTFNNHRKFYLDILNNVYPYVDFYQHAFGVELYRVLEIQHTTYLKGDHHARHVDVVFNNKSSLQRKISLILMLSEQTDYSGGKLIIDGNPVALDKGDMVLFKPNLFHAVEKIEEGVRKTLVMWVQGPQWK